MLHNPKTLICSIPLLLLSACTEEELTTDETVATDQVVDETPSIGHTAVVTSLGFGRQDDAGMSLGIDLDGHVSSLRDADGCYTADLIDPEGRTGIDNNFSQLMPALDAFGGGTIEDLIVGAINDGSLLLMIEVNGIDDYIDDEAVVVTVTRAIGDTFVGNDGYLEEGQTFDRDPDRGPYPSKATELVDGWVTAGPFQLDVPVQFFQHQILLDLRDAFLRFEVREDGTFSGFIAAGIPVEQITAISEIDGTDRLGEIIETVVPEFADLMGPEGECDTISATILFDSRLAFFYED